MQENISWQKLNFVCLVFLVHHRKCHTCFNRMGKSSKQSSYTLCVWHYEKLIKTTYISLQKGILRFPQGLLLLGDWKVWDTLVRAYLPGKTESYCFGCLSNTRLLNVFQKGSDRKDYSQIAFVITQRRTVSSWKYFRDIYCILKTSFYF